MESRGLTPVLPDGKRAGNVASTCDELHSGIVISRSGQDYGSECVPETDFVHVQRFDEQLWQCHYAPINFSSDATPVAGDVKPSSDTPLHWLVLVQAATKFQWSKPPKVCFHGHGWSSDEDALALRAPISSEATLFSTPADYFALCRLLREHPYPQHRLFIRRGHGFLLLADSISDAMTDLDGLWKAHPPQQSPGQGTVNH